MSDRSRLMPYVRMGNSGLKVSKIILGCMTYGDPKWQPWVLPEEEGLKHIKAAYDMGIQSFDTANTYSNGVSEVILGKAIKKYNLPREEIVVMTKLCPTVGREPHECYFGLPIDTDTLGYVNQHGLSRKHIFDSVNASLKRLQLDYIDLLQCHRFDHETPIQETMQALHDVVKAGYVRYVGMSSCMAWQFHIMQNYAITHNLTPFISMQNHYSLAYREEEREMFPTLMHFNVGSMPWATLAAGFLARPLSANSKRWETDTFMQKYAEPEGNKQINKRVEELAQKKGISMAQVALAWVLQRNGVTAPVVGTTSLKNLEDLAGAIHVKLTNEEMKYLEEPYRPMGMLAHAPF